MVGKDEDERRYFVEAMIDEEGLGREVGVKGVVEKEREGRRKVLIMEMEKEEDKEDILEKGGEMVGCGGR